MEKLKKFGQQAYAILRQSQVILWRKQFENCEEYQEDKSSRSDKPAENRRKLAEMAEFAKFTARDVTVKTKEKLLKMTEKERAENGIKCVGDEILFVIRLTIEQKCLDKGSPIYEAKELANQVN